MGGLVGLFCRATGNLSQRLVPRRVCDARRFAALAIAFSRTRGAAARGSRLFPNHAEVRDALGVTSTPSRGTAGGDNESHASVGDEYDRLATERGPARCDAGGDRAAHHV